MPKICTYRCQTANHEFEHWHNSSDEGPPDFCPICVQESKLSQVPAGMHIGGSPKSKAMNMAFDIAQRQYGLTDMKDSTREGESPYKAPPAPQGDARALQDAIDTSMSAIRQPLNPTQQSMASQFWGAGATNSVQAATANQTLLSAARQATAETRASDGGSPMHKFHEAMRNNPQDRVKFKIIGRG